MLGRINSILKCILPGRLVWPRKVVLLAAWWGKNHLPSSNRMWENCHEPAENKRTTSVSKINFSPTHISHKISWLNYHPCGESCNSIRFRKIEHRSVTYLDQARAWYQLCMNRSVWRRYAENRNKADHYVSQTRSRILRHSTGRTPQVCMHAAMSITPNCSAYGQLEWEKEWALRHTKYSANEIPGAYLQTSCLIIAYILVKRHRAVVERYKT